MNMEPTNHPCRKENDLNQISMRNYLCSMLIFQGFWKLYHGALCKTHTTSPLYQKKTMTFSPSPQDQVVGRGNKQTSIWSTSLPLSQRTSFELRHIPDAHYHMGYPYCLCALWMRNMMCKCKLCIILLFSFLLCILFFVWIGFQMLFFYCVLDVCTIQSMYQSLLGVYGAVHFAARMWW